jgi:drug/metabolite transporter (DMT)-like permease
MPSFRHLTSGRSTRLVPSAIGAIGVMLWASETTLITFTTAIPPVQTVGLAFVFAALLSPLVWWLTGSGPRGAFRLPARVWLIAVGALVGYHACIYYATQKAPPAAAAMLQGTTPLMIVLGSALVPGERLRWWHVAGATFGFVGVLMLIDGGEAAGSWPDAAFYLSLIGIAAALWGLYAIFARSQPDVPTSALGVFYAASAAICLAAHGVLESWVTPTGSEWAAIAGLGLLPMGLAIYFWDFGIKQGDIQALGAFAYVEPFIGAALVALFAHGYLNLSLFLPGVLVVGGAVLASASLWNGDEPEAAALGARLE